MENTNEKAHFKIDGAWIKGHVSEIASYGGLAACILIFTILTPIFGSSIWSASKLSILLSDVIVLAIASVGAVFIYALGSMDISIGKQIGLYCTLFVLIGNSTGNLFLGILASMGVAIIIGIINGSAGELFNIVSVVASLVIQMILSGISSLVYSKLGTRNISLTAFKVPLFKSTWFMLLVLILELVIVTYLFNYTKYGKNARAIGANPVAAAQSGINIIRYKVIAYVISGMAIIVAALFNMGYTATASDSSGTGLEMNIMVALILGGMPLSGGMKSRVSCAIVGSFTFSILNVGLPILGASTATVLLIKAILFAIIVLITCRKPKGVLFR